MIRKNILSTREEIDWYAHYQKKLDDLDFSSEHLPRFHDQHRALIDTILEKKPKRVLEAGCGLCRDSMVLSDAGIEVTVLDRDDRLLKVASENCKRMGLSINFISGDFFDLEKAVAHDQYDLIFHSGVLEHFYDKDIQAIVEQQLLFSPEVVFTVPIASESNNKYFNDNNFRRLLEPETWMEILQPFSVEEAKVVTGRHEDLLVVLKGTL